MVALVVVKSSLAEFQLNDSLGGRNVILVSYYWNISVALVVVISSLIELQINGIFGGLNVIFVYCIEYCGSQI